ncbi:MAG: T9SS type A sorting domain-containing protein [Bacteroidota bacterium]
MKKIFVLFWLTIISLTGFAQDWEWARAFPSNGATRAFDGEIDSLGNAYVCGTLVGQLEVDGQVLGQDTTIEKFFVSKISPTGQALWTLVPISASSNVFCSGITVDKDQNVIVTGAFRGALIFGNDTIIAQGSSIWYAELFLMKLDPFGNILWLRTDGGLGETISKKVKTDSQGNIIVGGHLRFGGQVIAGVSLPVIDPGYNDFFLAKYDSQGNGLWAQRWGTSYQSIDFLQNMAVDDADNIYVVGNYVDSLGIQDTTLRATISTHPNRTGFVTKIRQDGSLGWAKTFAGSLIGIRDIAYSHGDKLTIAGNVDRSMQFGDTTLLANWDGNISYSSNAFIGRLDTAGNELWARQLRSIHNNYSGGRTFTEAVAEDHDGSIYLTGFGRHVMLVGDTVLNGDSTYAGFNYLHKFDTLGNYHYTDIQIPPPFGTVGGAGYIDAFIGKEKRLLVIGSTAGSTSLGPFTLHAPMPPVSAFIASWRDEPFDPPNRIRGQVFSDDNQNCIIDPNELGLANQLILTDPGNYLAMTDSTGNYELALPLDSVAVSLIVPPALSALVANNCLPPPGIPVLFDSLTNLIDSVNFSHYIQDCPVLTLDIQTGLRRYCAMSHTQLHYQNAGNDTAFNVDIIAAYPEHIKPLSANFPWQWDTDSNLVFSFAQIPPGASGIIIIHDSVLCPGPQVTGLSQCVYAWTKPDNDCLEVSNNWSGASLKVEGECLQSDTARFVIRNEGAADMLDSVSYTIWRDSALVWEQSIMLTAGDSLQISILTTGEVIRLRVEQVPFHPYNQWVVKGIEGCGIDQPNLSISKGILTEVPLLDQMHLSRSVDCKIIRNSYDPNDKRGFPLGLGEQHYLPSGTSLNYQIRFQNTGNDTAFRVVIRDTLPPELDIMSLNITAASHPFSLELSQTHNRAIAFKFFPIALVDSSTNLTESQGFISFSINPYDSLAQGTKIENFADIYFDLNPPIRTDTAIHTIFDAYPIAISDSGIEVLCNTLPKPEISVVNFDSLSAHVIGTHYQWFVNGDSLSFTTQIIPIKQSGVYQVQAIIDNCPSPLSDPFSFIIENILEESFNNQLRLEPNPSSGIIGVRLEKPLKHSSSLKLYSIHGSLLALEVLQTNTESFSYDLSSFSDGIYFLQLGEGKMFKIILLR